MAIPTRPPLNTTPRLVACSCPSAAMEGVRLLLPAPACTLSETRVKRYLSEEPHDALPSGGSERIPSVATAESRS